MFQREKNGKSEPGILLNEGRKGILDIQGQIPEEVWDYRTVPGMCLDISELDNWLPYFSDWLKHIETLILAGKGNKDATDI